MYDQIDGRSSRDQRDIPADSRYSCEPPIKNLQEWRVFSQSKDNRTNSQVTHREIDTLVRRKAWENPAEATMVDALCRRKQVCSALASCAFSTTRWRRRQDTAGSASRRTYGIIGRRLMAQFLFPTPLFMLNPNAGASLVMFLRHQHMN